MQQKWQQMYNDKLKTPEEAVKLLDDGDGISLPTINGTPRFLTKALAERIMKDEVKDLEFIVGLNLNGTDLLKPEVLSRTHYCGGYLSAFERQAASDMDFLVWRFGDNARLMHAVRDTNVCFMTVSPMDAHGYFSAALNCSHTYSMFQKRKAMGAPVKVFLEVNKNAPACYGFNHFHISEVTALVEADWDLIEIPFEEPSERDIAIGSYVAEHIPDGATVQLGIGGIPNAVGRQLAHKKDLGCHSEMIVEAYLDLYKCGALNNSKKSYMPDRFVATLLAGSKELYQWVDRNPSICIYGIDECATPDIVAKNDNFMSINSTLECDLSGQCISETQGIKPYSGMGGQADFVEGSWRSKGGKSFLCLYSTYTNKQGEVNSKISPVVKGWISITRNDVQYIATEYGCVFLKGKTMEERVKAMTSLAHPDFREWLVYEAKKNGMIRSISDVNIKKMRQEI